MMHSYMILASRVTVLQCSLASVSVNINNHSFTFHGYQLISNDHNNFMFRSALNQQHSAKQKKNLNHIAIHMCSYGPGP